jgi:hypothetical protein
MTGAQLDTRITDPPDFVQFNRISHDAIPERFVAHVAPNLAIFGQADVLTNKIHIVESWIALRCDTRGPKGSIEVNMLG